MGAMGPISERYESQWPIVFDGHAEVLLGIVRVADGFARTVAVKRVREELLHYVQVDAR